MNEKHIFKKTKSGKNSKKFRLHEDYLIFSIYWLERNVAFVSYRVCRLLWGVSIIGYVAVPVVFMAFKFFTAASFCKGISLKLKGHRQNKNHLRHITHP